MCAQLYLTLCDSMDCSSARPLCPWNFPDKNIGVGCHFLLQGISETQGSNPSLMSLALADRFFTTEPPGNHDCSHKIKRRLLLGRKTMTNLGSVLKSRDINLPTHVPIVKAVVCPVVCETWTIKNAEHQKIEVFKLWCWRRLLRVPWTARRSN